MRGTAVAKRAPEFETWLANPYAMPPREFWRLANRPRRVDPNPIRAGAALLLAFYVLSSIIRHDARHPELDWVRLAVCLYALAGVAVASRLDWARLRAYTLGLAVLLPGSAGFIIYLYGRHVADVALLGLATFVPLVFLQTGVDLAVAVLLLAAGHGLMLAFCPLAVVPRGLAALVVAGAMGSGSIAGLALIAFRGAVGQSAEWWRRACNRERLLREFAEVAAGKLASAGLFAEFAARLRSAFGGGWCGLVLRDAESGAFRLAAAAGEVRGWRAPVAANLLLGRMREVAAGVEKTRGPIVRPQLGDREAERLGAGCLAGGPLVVLPVPAEDAVVGAVLLVDGPRPPIEEEDLLLWRAMANQVGVAVATGRLLERLRQALNVKNEFVNTMSHELRSPLNVILGYAEMLSEDRSNIGFNTARIRASALELLELVENTMTVARLGSGKVILQLGEFAWRDLVLELSESTGASAEAKAGVPVRWWLDEELPPAHLDRLKVKEIVHNLVSNALKFTERGEVVVSFRRAGEAEVQIEVADTGPGIPSESQARIFEMFERGGPAEAGPGGVGLGLYIVKGLVGLMDGTIRLSSALGVGSRFSVRLPLCLRPPAEERERAVGAR
jgi:signal transduction histidine kinase